VKKFFLFGSVFFSMFFIYSCGNPLLRLTESNVGGGSGAGEIAAGTTEEEIPKGVSPIYVDTNGQLAELLSGTSVDYPNDGYYILRGNEVPGRTFTVTRSVRKEDFKGTLTGWLMDETGDYLTKIVSDFGECLFTVMDGATVSWLKFETNKQVAKLVPDNSPIIIANSQFAGIVTAFAKNTTFKNVLVSGRPVEIDVSSLSIPSNTKNIYVGGIVGKAEGTTTFEKCRGEVEVSVLIPSAPSSLEKVYAGGIVGSLKDGSVKNSAVGIKSPYGNNFQAITVKVDGGSGDQYYAGGITGQLVSGTIGSAQGGENAVIPVHANVSATGVSSIISAGGYVGEITDGGTVSVHGLDLNGKPSSLSVTLEVKATATANDAYDGGIAGKSTGTSPGNNLKNNHLSGGMTVVALSSPAKNAYAGGIAGYSEGNIENSSFTTSSGGVNAGSDVVGKSAKKAYAGGIAGYTKGIISLSYADVRQAGIEAKVNVADGIAAAGGIAGQTEAEISKSYAVAVVNASAGDIAGSGTPYGAIAGGIAGISKASISDTFALAQVDARVATNANSVPVYAGGIAGYLLTGSSVKNSYVMGFVLAHTLKTNNVYAGGIAGYAAGTAGGVEKSVALQKYVGSDGTMFRVIGENAAGSSLLDNYAYEKMTKYARGSVIVDSTNNTAAGKGGQDISETEAKNFSFYSTLGWTTGGEWESSGSGYPKLKDLSYPSLPTWAELP
jgi:hypothetical protein